MTFVKDEREVESLSGDNVDGKGSILLICESLCESVRKDAMSLAMRAIVDHCAYEVAAEGRLMNADTRETRRRSNQLARTFILLFDSRRTGSSIPFATSALY